jgi:hypothetical protein
MPKKHQTSYINAPLGKKLLGFRNMQEKLEEIDVSWNPMNKKKLFS